MKSRSGSYGVNLAMVLFVDKYTIEWSEQTKMLNMTCNTPKKLSLILDISHLNLYTLISTSSALCQDRSFDNV